MPNSRENHHRNGLLPAQTSSIAGAITRLSDNIGNVENSPHRRLDVVMNEDQDRTRMGHGPQNLAMLRHMVINATQKEGSKIPAVRKIQTRRMGRRLL